jgi:hypothetical protein
VRFESLQRGDWLHLYFCHECAELEWITSRSGSCVPRVLCLRCRRECGHVDSVQRCGPKREDLPSANDVYGILSKAETDG